MEPNAALLAGLAAGLAVAVQVGAVSLLLIEASIVAGPRAGAAAGLGVATADLGFGAVAAVAGGAAGAALASHETEIRIVGATAVGAIALHGLAAPMRGGWQAEREGGGGDGAGEAGSGGAGPGASAGIRGRGSAGEHYARFLAITTANPLTIASFVAVAAALSLDGPAAAVAFAVGVGLASAAWHLLLTLSVAYAGRRLTSRVRRSLAIGGRLAVLGIAAHLAFGG